MKLTRTDYLQNLVDEAFLKSSDAKAFMARWDYEGFAECGYCPLIIRYCSGRGWFLEQNGCDYFFALDDNIYLGDTWQVAELFLKQRLLPSMQT